MPTQARVRERRLRDSVDVSCEEVMFVAGGSSLDGSIGGTGIGNVGEAVNSGLS